MEFLGDAKNMRLDALPPLKRAVIFIRWALERVSRGTVGLYRNNFTAEYSVYHG